MSSRPKYDGVWENPTRTVVLNISLISAVRRYRVIERIRHRRPVEYRVSPNNIRGLLIGFSRRAAKKHHV